DERQPGVISGTVREDLDNDDLGDTPIAGATVVLKDAQGNPVATTTTDGSGNYVFNNVPAGSYTVEETNKPGYTDVSDVDGGNPNVISVTLTQGQSSTGNDFVDERPATLGDRVWEDTNANGVQDAGEAGIAGVTVELKDENGTPVATTTTDANGNYSFTVTPGTYSVAIVAPAGYLVTTPNQGNDATDSDINAAGQTGPIVLSSGENDPTVDAGLYRAAQLGDRVWLDTNGNGQQDAGEAGVAGVKVTLLDASGNAVGSPLTTDASGNYLFTGLRPGTYSVQFDKTTLPAGYSFTTANTGSDASDSDASVTDGTTAQTVLDSGESDRSWDAGIIASPGAITGTVLEDTNNDNVGDTPLAGVTVVLKDPVSGTVISTTTTDASGNYSFNGVPPGNYVVQETNKPGYTDVSDKDGGDLNSIAVTVTPGATNSGNDFVDERLPGAISGTVREDNDN
ncbi:SdrD B-like domain-containing protein, partial [Zoogloea sp.]|uniref:SdrD B-like domain-containing protein n=1 Tax=Zoogloea sp. TaxID=49181 RepID=UPI0025EA8EB3